MSENKPEVTNDSLLALLGRVTKTYELLGTRPKWCQDKSCKLLRQSGNDIFCVGQMQVPVLHDDTPNTHTFCLRPQVPDPVIHTFQINFDDARAIRIVLQSLIERYAVVCPDCAGKGELYNGKEKRSN